MTILAIIIFLYGITIGSFLNVCIYRMPLEQSVVFGNSHCTKCEKNIKFYDLIPLFSYMFLRGKCRFCGEKISIRYPLVELINGVLYLLAFLKFGLSMEMVFYCLLSSILFVIAVIDFEHKIIPNELLIAALLLGIVFHILNGGFLNSVIGFFAVSVLLYIIALLSKGGIGGGDIKMMAAFGFCIGWQNILLSLFIASIIGSMVAIYLLVFKKYGRKTEVPFGPFLAVGIYISIFFGTGLINGYFRFFNI